MFLSITYQVRHLESLMVLKPGFVIYEEPKDPFMLRQSKALVAKLKN